MMTRILGAVVVGLLLAALDSPSSDTDVKSVAIGDFGVFEPVKAGTEAATGTTAGIVQVATSMRLLERTDRIPRSRGVAFGFMFDVVGTPKGRKVQAQVTVVHPPFTNPKTGKRTERETWTQEPTIGIPSYSGWAFDETWEMVPGEWTIRVSVKPSVSVEKVFTVY